MIRPDAIPVHVAHSRVTLTPGAIRTLFGPDVRVRGMERVRVVSPAGGEVAVHSIAGADLVLELSRTDLAKLGHEQLRLVGPRGTAHAPRARALARELVLPSGLLRSWRLAIGDEIALEAGTVIFTDVVVSEGEPSGATLDDADVAAAGIRAGGTAALRRDIRVEPIAAAPPDDAVDGRLITENDVRQARLKGRRIRVRPGQMITPAAASLGKELGILDL